MKSEKPWMSSGPSGYRTHSERYPMDLFSYTREAARCRDERRFLAMIAMSSTAVELVINRDTRTCKARALKRTAHGEIERFISDLSDYDPAAEKLAKQHECKMREFVSEWYNTAPDVQEGRIRKHQWKVD